MKIKHSLTPLESRVEESHKTIFCQTLKTFKQVKESIAHTGTRKEKLSYRYKEKFNYKIMSSTF